MVKEMCEDSKSCIEESKDVVLFGSFVSLYWFVPPLAACMEILEMQRG